MSTTHGGGDPRSRVGDAPPVALSPRAVRLAALLEGVEGRTVALPELWQLWATADPASAGSPQRRTALAQVLEHLAAAGLVGLSKKQDTAAHPPLPTRLTLPATAPTTTAAAVARTVVWRPELAWVVQARLTIGQIEQLRRVNTWLRDRGADHDVLPLRERSLEVLGHEKALDSLLASSVFAPGRLSLELLRTFRPHPPLPAVRVGEGPVLLVVENDNTFHSIRAALTADPGPVGFVAWGAGGAFEASVRSCGDLPGVARVSYFGDLDAAGLRIPRNASAAAQREGLPPVTAALSLYGALFATTVREPGQPLVAPHQAQALAEWLDDPQLTADAALLLETGLRIPQEALTATDLTRDRDWISQL